MLHSSFSQDYAVLIPQEYKQAIPLTKNLPNACEVKSNETFCSLYNYIDLSQKNNVITLKAAKADPSRQRFPIQLFNDTEVLSKLNFLNFPMVLLSPEKVSVLLLYFVQYQCPIQKQLFCIKYLTKTSHAKYSFSTKFCQVFWNFLVSFLKKERRKMRKKRRFTLRFS